MRRIDCHDAIKRVKSSYDAALRTVDAMIYAGNQRPAYLHEFNLDSVELRSLPLELHDVDFAWIFARFESRLRDYWRASIRNSKPTTEQLISSIASRRGVPEDTLDTVHEIRRFRNYLIHEEHEVARRFSIDEACKNLNTFLARLPREW